MTKPSQILVLSYNICFQAMCGDNFGTAAALGGYCGKPDNRTGLTLCAKNMAEFLDTVPNSVGQKNFDFVGLQEANNYDDFKRGASGSLDQMTMISSKSVPRKAERRISRMSMASFYDHNKYKLDDHVCSQFSTYNHERPFHVLLLTEISTNEKFIFINVHCPHGGSTNEKMPPRTEKQSYNYNTFYEFHALEFDLSNAVKTLRSFDSSHSYKIIMTGDFNETGWKGGSIGVEPKSWKPLEGAGVDIEVGINNVVHSCTQDDGYWTSPNAHKGGDYVFSSGNAATISVPSTYKFAPTGLDRKNLDPKVMDSFWMSDHLPVMAVLT